MLTIRGMGFDGGWAYRCRIGAATVLANFTSEVTDDCAIPPCVLCVTADDSALLDVEIALDARTFTTDGVTHLRMHRSSRRLHRARRPSPAVRASSCTGPLWRRDAFLVVLVGTDLDGTGRVPASYANGGVGDGSDDMLHCDAPAAKEAGVAPVRVSLDNLAWSNTSADFTYTGSTVAFAAPFPPDPPGIPPRLPNACRRRRCRRRSRRPRDCRRLTLVGIAEEDKTAGLPVVYGISPSSGPSGGGTPLRVTGNGLTGGDGYRYRFGTMRSPWRAAASNVVDATFVDANTLHCDAPDAAAAAATAILWRDFMDPLSQRRAIRRNSAARFARAPLIPPPHLSLYPSGRPGSTYRTLAFPPARRPCLTPSTHPSLAGDSQDGVVELDEITAPTSTIPWAPASSSVAASASAQARRGAATWRSPRRKTGGRRPFIARFGMRAVAPPPPPATAPSSAAAAGSGRAPVYYGVLHHAERARPRPGSPSCSTRRGRRMRWR